MADAKVLSNQEKLLHPTQAAIMKNQKAIPGLRLP